MGYATADANKVKSLVTKCIKDQKKRMSDSWDKLCERTAKETEAYIKDMNSRNSIVRFFYTEKFRKITQRDMRHACGGCEYTGFTCNACYDYIFTSKANQERMEKMRDLLSLCNLAIELGKEEVIVGEDVLSYIGY